MRGKEEAHDYRYFPDPDLVPLVIADSWVERVRAELPELPEAKQARFISAYGLTAHDTDILTAEKAVANYFDACATLHKDAKACANWVMGDVQRRRNEEGLSVAQIPVTPQMLAGILERIADKTISGKIAKTVFDEMWSTGKSADEVIEAKGLKQVSDSGAIEKMVDDVIAANPGQAQEFAEGKDKLLGFFVGQVMKASQGKANPGMVNELLCKKLRG
jgi:aspartyl-tRNA(Asn)/glutamyl-tRNA(Gln) amidotransferase subunit B